MQYITTKKRTVALLIVLCCVMGLIPVIAFSHTTMAEELPQLIVEEQTNADGDTVYHVQGIKEFMSAPQTRSSNSESRLNTLLRTLQYSEEEIANMSSEQKANYARAKEVYLSANSYEYPEVGSGSKYSYKLTVSLRVILIDERASDSSYIYVLYGNADYDKTQGIQWVPMTRGIDAMMFGWTPTARFANNYRNVEAVMECESASIWTGATKSYHYDSLKEGAQFVTEYALDQGWGAHIDLPNNTLVNGYKNFEFAATYELYAKENFTLNFAYAHRTFNGVVDLKVDSESGMIYATSTMTDVAYAPKLYIQIPTE